MLFGLKNIGNIITEEKEELLPLIYEEIEEDNLNFKLKFNIEVQIVATFPDKEYGNNEFSYRRKYFMYNFDKYVDEDNIDDILNKADEEINTDIEEDHDKDSIIGIQTFHFELIIIEYIYY